MNNEIIEKIKKELALENLPQNEMENIIADLGGKIMQNMLINFTSSLSEEEIIEWDEVLESKDQDKVNDFIEEHCDDIEKLLAVSSKEVVDVYKKEI